MNMHPVKVFFTWLSAIFLLCGLVIPHVHAGPEKRCRACHAFGDKNNTGPGLKGVFGRRAGTHPGFKYSPSLKNGDWIWDEEHLRKWIYNTKDAIREFTGDPNAKVAMPKYKIKGKKADQIIEFLKGL